MSFVGNISCIRDIMHTYPTFPSEYDGKKRFYVYSSDTSHYDQIVITRDVKKKILREMKGENYAVFQYRGQYYLITLKFSGYPKAPNSEWFEVSPYEIPVIPY